MAAAAAAAKTTSTVDDMLDATFEAAVKHIAEISAAITAADKALIEGLDKVIPLAIRKAVKDNNCNALIMSVRALPKKRGNVFAATFIQYCHSPRGLAMPAETLIYSAPLARFLCNMPALVAWFQDNAGKLDLPFSKWQAAEKEYRRKWENNPQKEIKSALERALKIMNSYGLHFQDKNLDQIRELIKKQLEK